MTAALFPHWVVSLWPHCCSFYSLQHGNSKKLSGDERGQCVCACVRERERARMTVQWESCREGKGSQSVEISSVCYEGADTDSWVNKLLSVFYNCWVLWLLLQYESSETARSWLPCQLGTHKKGRCGFVFNFHLPPISQNVSPPCCSSLLSPFCFFLTSNVFFLYLLSLPGECWFHKKRRVYHGEDGSDIQGQGPPQNSIWPWEQTCEGHLWLRRTTGVKTEAKARIRLREVQLCFFSFFVHSGASCSVFTSPPVTRYYKCLNFASDDIIDLVEN